MRVSIICPSIDLVVDPQNDVDVNGANIALWIQLRTYANHPAFESLELFLPPKSLLIADDVAKFAQALLEPQNRGKGKLSVHSVYALGDIWADGKPRILHTDDLWALSRDRHLRDTFAKGPIAHICDTHCLGHFALHRSLREVAHLDQVEGDAIIACSRATAAAVDDAYDLPYKVLACRRRIDSGDLRPAKPGEKEAARARFGLPQGMPLGMFLGRITPAVKGELTLLVDTLVGRPGGLIVTGVTNMPGYSEVLQGYAQMRGVADRVFFHGRIPPSDRAAWYHAADLFLFPGDCVNEAFGQTTIEALACGLPVIQSAWDGLKETIAEGVGTHVSTIAAPAPERLEHLSVALETPGQFLALAQATVVDRDEWYAAYDYWIASEEKRKVGGSMARQLFESTFDPPIIEAQYIALLEKCLEGATTGQRKSRRVEPGPLQVDYSSALRHYTSVLWNPSFLFEETEKGKAWRSGGEAPYMYGELEPILDPELMSSIRERVGHSPLTATQLSIALSDSITTDRDVWFHAMFLAKQGFLTLRHDIPLSRNSPV